MKKEILLQKFKTRLEKEEKAYDNELNEEEKYHYLPRKRYFSESRKLSCIASRIAALKTAISFLEKRFRDVDFHEGCMMGLSPNNENWEDILSKANSYMLRERAEAAKILFETSLPIAKKQILAELEPWLPYKSHEIASAI